MKEAIDNILKNIISQVNSKLIHKQIIVDDSLLEKVIDHTMVRNRIRVIIEEGAIIKEEHDQDYIEMFLKKSYENIVDSLVHSYNFHKLTPPIPEDY